MRVPSRIIVLIAATPLSRISAKGYRRSLGGAYCHPRVTEQVYTRADKFLNLEKKKAIAAHITDCNLDGTQRSDHRQLAVGKNMTDQTRRMVQARGRGRSRAPNGNVFRHTEPPPLTTDERYLDPTHEASKDRHMQIRKASRYAFTRRGPDGNPYYMVDPFA